jgi:hypothetical protein
MRWWWDLLVALASGLLVVWVTLLVTLALARPRGSALREAARLLPDALRLLTRLARDRSLPRAVRVWLWLLLGGRHRRRLIQLDVGLTPQRALT